MFKQLGQKHFGYEMYLCGEQEDGEAKVAVCNNSRVRQWELGWVGVRLCFRTPQRASSSCECIT